jgi:hypothetical protein
MLDDLANSASSGPDERTAGTCIIKITLTTADYAIRHSNEGSCGVIHVPAFVPIRRKD